MPRWKCPGGNDWGGEMTGGGGIYQVGNAGWGGGNAQESKKCISIFFNLVSLWGQGSGVSC